MANAKPAISLNDMLQADRKRRKAEALAQEMLGSKARRANAPGAANGRKAGAPLPSMASRVGVNKRTASPSNRSNTRTARQRPGPVPSHLSRPPANARNGDNFRPRNDLQSSSSYDDQFADDTRVGNGNLGQNLNGYDGADISIRGAAAGAYPVIAQNFAPGTTAADIEMVMENIDADITSCILLASTPTVIAQMTFATKAGADKVVATYNNKRADGWLLHLYHKNGGPKTPGVGAADRPIPTPRAVAPVPEPEPEPLQEDTMEVDDLAASRQEEDRAREDRRRAPPPQDRVNGPRYRDDYDRRPRRAEPEWQDGRYGFSDRTGFNDRRGGGGYKDDRQGRYREAGGMYSDSMRRGGRGAGGGGGQNYRP